METPHVERKYTPFKEILDEELQDPEVQKEWDRTQLAAKVSNWLLRYRIENDLTQAELAEMLGWQQPIVARLESGDREPSIETLHRLAERLGTTATIAIRPEGVEVHFTKPRAVAKESRRRAQRAAALAASSSLRSRRGPSVITRRAQQNSSTHTN